MTSGQGMGPWGHEAARAKAAWAAKAYLSTNFMHWVSSININVVRLRSTKTMVSTYVHVTVVAKSFQISLKENYYLLFLMFPQGIRFFWVFTAFVRKV